ncbi:acyltransferase [Streptomyces sp. NPDC059639]|uniref:acyltransferase n=1 Tax=Streptomyces sp. NPDC059639 TaxID=3346891 RepID=UPI0036D01A42
MTSVARAIYTVYIVHVPLVVTLQYLLAGRGLPATAAWCVVAVAGTVSAYALSAGLRRLPGARRVL